VGGNPAAIDAATRRVRDERWPEIVAVQQMQQHQARILFAPDRWTTRLMNRLLPWLGRTGLQRISSAVRPRRGRAVGGLRPAPSGQSSTPGGGCGFLLLPGGDWDRTSIKAMQSGPD